MPPAASRRRHRRKRIDDEPSSLVAASKSAVPVKARADAPAKKAASIASDFVEDDDDELLSFSALDAQRKRGTKRGRAFGTASSAAIAATSAVHHQQEEATENDSGVKYSAAHLAGLRASQLVLGAGADGASEAASPAQGASTPPPPGATQDAAARPSIPKDEPWLASDGGGSSPLAAQHQAAAVLARAVAGSAAARLPSRGSAPFAAARIALDAVPRRFVGAVAASRGHAQAARAQLAHFHSTAQGLQTEDAAHQHLLADMSSAFDVLSEAHRRMHWAVRVARAAAVALQQLVPTALALRSAHRAHAMHRLAAAQTVLDNQGTTGAQPAGSWQQALELGPPPPTSSAKGGALLSPIATAPLAQVCTGDLQLQHGIDAACACIDSVLSRAASSELAPATAAAATAPCASRHPQLAQDIAAASSLEGAFLAIRVAADSAVAAADVASAEPQGVAAADAAVPGLLRSAQRFKAANAKAYTDTYCSMTMGALLHPLLHLQAACSPSLPDFAPVCDAVKDALVTGAAAHDSSTADEANSDSTLAARGVLSAQLRGLQEWLRHSWAPVSTSSTHQASAALQRALRDVASLPAAVTSVAPFNSSRGALEGGLAAAALDGARDTIGHLYVRVSLPQDSAVAACSPGTVLGAGVVLQLLRSVCGIDGLFREPQVELRSFCVEQVLGDRLLAMLTTLAQAASSSGKGGALRARLALQLAALAVQGVPAAWWSDNNSMHDWSMALTAVGEEMLSQCCVAAAGAVGDAAARQAAHEVAAALRARSPQLAAQLQSVIA